MSRILALHPPYNGLTSIVNVVDHVGPGAANKPDDVRVIQRLLQLCAQRAAAATGVSVPQITGRFDGVTGFWIYHAQAYYKRPTIDGVVSPARGSHYGPGGGVWTIVTLNEYAKKNSPNEYAAFVAECAKP
jgi:hypothetical protein